MARPSRLAVWVAGAAISFACVPGAVSAAAAKPATSRLVVVVDSSKTPDIEAWATKAKTLVEKWHPRLSRLLASPGFTPPMEVTVVFSEIAGPAGTAGNRIEVSAPWVRKHPEDEGMLIHELVHVIQSYPKYDPTWLVEGVADYVRFFVFEPKTKIGPPNPARSSYKEGYRTTAAFLDWMVRKHDRKFISKVNRALREDTYTSKLFEESGGKPLDDLWHDYVAERQNESAPKR